MQLFVYLDMHWNTEYCNLANNILILNQILYKFSYFLCDEKSHLAVQLYAEGLLFQTYYWAAWRVWLILVCWNASRFIDWVLQRKISLWNTIYDFVSFFFFLVCIWGSARDNSSPSSTKLNSRFSISMFMTFRWVGNGIFPIYRKTHTQAFIQ